MICIIGFSTASLKKTFKMFVPYEIYFVKMKGKSSDGVSINRVTSRSAYTALSAKKKLKYIKQAEENYDSYDVILNTYPDFESCDLIFFIWKFNREGVKPRFSFFLSKSETEILLKSYGMPDLVPKLVLLFSKCNYFIFGYWNFDLKVGCLPLWWRNWAK